MRFSETARHFLGNFCPLETVHFYKFQHLLILDISISCKITESDIFFSHDETRTTCAFPFTQQELSTCSGKSKTNALPKSREVFVVIVQSAPGTAFSAKKGIHTVHTRLFTLEVSTHQHFAFKYGVHNGRVICILA